MKEDFGGALPTGLLDSLASGIVAFDRDGCVEYANGAAESLFRTSRSNLLGRRIEHLINNPEPLRELCDRSRRNESTCILREFEAAPLAHPELTFNVDVAASPLADGGVVLETYDARQQAKIDGEAELMTQHDVGRAIVRQLAHEIKNPLGGLRGAAQLLAKKLATPALGEYTDVIIREADRLVTLVDTMLGPTGPVDKQAVNIHRLLDHVWRLLQSEATEKIVIERDYDPSLPDIALDEDRIIQALLNIGRNAVQAVGDDGQVVLRTRAENGFVIAERRHATVLRIDIEDSGPGVDDVLRDRIFYPLVTGRSSGTGLGLAVAQDLINRHGGLVKLTGKAPTVFSVFLPAQSSGNE